VCFGAGIDRLIFIHAASRTGKAELAENIGGNRECLNEVTDVRLGSYL
jgi:hypothetical protein